MTETFVDPRSSLYGDVPLSLIVDTPGDTPALTLFRQAHKAIDQGDQGAAIAALQEIVAMPDQSSRTYLQAWTSLRGLGAAVPPIEDARVLGVALDVVIKDERITVSAYADGSACFHRHDGVVMVWAPAPGTAIAKIVAEFVDFGQRSVYGAPTVYASRPPFPAGADITRFSMLCPGGLRGGQCPVAHADRVPTAKEATAIGTKLMRALTEIKR